MRLPFYLSTRLTAVRICHANDDAAAYSAVGLLPPLEGNMPPKTDQGIIYTSCNDLYLDRYVLNLLRSARLHSPRQHFHLHLYDPAPDTRESVLALAEKQNLTVSWEYSSKAKTHVSMKGGMYFVCARFIRMWQLLDASRSQIFAIDADAMIRNDLTNGFSSQFSEDISLFLRRNRLNPLRKVLGAAVMINSTEIGLRFIRDCAVVCVYYIRAGGWEAIDQLILYLVWRWYDRYVAGFRCGELTMPFSDWHYSDNSYVWHAKGSRKDAQIPLDRVLGKSD